MAEPEVPQVMRIGLREASRNPDRVQHLVGGGAFICVADLRSGEVKYWICPPDGQLSGVLPAALAAWEHQLPGPGAPPDSLGPPPSWTVRREPELQPGAA